MRYMKKNAGYFLLVAFMLVLNGCASMGSSSDSPPPMENLPPLSNFVGEYRDIELPIDMKYNHKKSMVVRTDSFTGGVFYFSGKVERDSLKNFILASMQKNKWKRAGEVSYDSVLLAFTKPNKSCTVVLEEGFGGSLGSTYAAIYVAEDVSASSGGN
ncbi:MAG: hypothetical protein KJ990_01855 [Proteobacteria bacterium]|nr:hypothetical protein [Pseudomonadota bacterium]MBU1649515.1 hypothetical protein [Pseudomonadota bacterium]